jgi:predicted nucleic acid-binding protein
LIVIDASALLEAFLQTPRGRLIEQRIFTPGESLHAPYLLDIEVAQVLRRLVIGRRLLPERGEEILDDLAQLHVRRYPHNFFLTRVWELRDNLAAYDAVYIALAEYLGARIVTCDRRMAAAPLHHAQVDLV